MLALEIDEVRATGDAMQCNARTDAVRERGGITGRANKHGQPGLTEHCNLSEVHIGTEPSAQKRLILKQNPHNNRLFF